MRPFKIFTGSSNPELSQKIAEQLGTPLADANLTRFSDGEIRFEINENVRGMDAFVVQSTCRPVNESIMELLVMGDALKRASVSTICAVIPYYGYARQDRKVAPRTPISARLIADLITATGFDRLMVVDLHAGQIQGFFNFPVDHLFGSYVLVPYLQEKYGKQDLCVVSPDAGGTERARVVAKKLDCPLAIVDKRRDAPNSAKAMNLIGEVESRVAILLDDMIDTAGTLNEGAKLLKEKGAHKVVAAAVHPVFSGAAFERVSTGPFDEIVVTDTIPLLDSFKTLKNLTVLSVAPMVAETIRRLQRNDSISSMFS